ncbi:MAG: hypothetical protein HY347_04050 [candidate division NC10 bacterium]|nr:hypothetical protein [candidate division NC10 bacterium]
MMKSKAKRNHKVVEAGLLGAKKGTPPRMWMLVTRSGRWFLEKLHRNSSGEWQVQRIPIKTPEDFELAFAQTLGSEEAEQELSEAIFQVRWSSFLQEARKHEESLWQETLEQGKSKAAFTRWWGREVDQICARHEPRFRQARGLPTRLRVIQDMQTEIKALKIPNHFRGMLKASRRPLKKIEELKKELESNYDARVQEVRTALRSSKRWEALQDIPWLSPEVRDKPGRLYAERLVKEQYARDFGISLKTVERSLTQLRKPPTS